MSVILKCQKCRSILINEVNSTILDTHGKVIDMPNNTPNFDCTGKIVDVWYLQETELPEWITNSINDADWQKGKLKCPQCSLRVGSFDFVSGLKCSCETYILPSIRFVKSKCDVYAK